MERAVAAGRAVEMGVKARCSGHRSGTVVDPAGHQWTLATHKEDVSPEEMTKRMAGMSKHA